MAAFLNDQLDFIFFFYGLAFLLLGATSWAISRRRPDELSWKMLAAFGLIHGVGEWLDLGALILGDRPTYAAVRIGVMTASFVFLAEFGRLQLGGLAPRRWVYLPVIGLVVVTGHLAGPTEAGIASRYTLGLFGSLAASWALVRLAERLSGTGRFHARTAALAFALYALAAGVIVPEAPFWPANVANYAVFTSLTGIPIQLIRGLLACWVALSVWAIWGQQLASEVSSHSFAAYLRRQFLWASGIMLAILLLGWLLTERLGDVYRRNVEIEAAVDIDLLASRLAGEIDVAGALTKVLAASPIVREALEQAEGQVLAQANEILAVHVEAGRAQAGYLLNEGGATVASAGPLAHRPASELVGGAHDDGAVEPSAGFLFDAATNMIVHFTRQPVLGGEGRAVGAAALVVSIEGFAGDLTGLNRPYFFVDPHGVVMMSNVSEAVNRTLWPLNPATLAERASLAALDLEPIASAEMEDAAWVNFGGSRDYVRRRFIAGTDWSLIILKPTRQIFATRFVGIVITLLTAIVALMYLLGKERWMHEAAQRETQSKLQGLARDMSIKAITDPLTGLYNRLRLKDVLPREMARADRTGSALSVVMFDIDRFKRINDSFGHATGDKVLVALSRVAAGSLRATDHLVRWGGEEFLVVLPDANAAEARIVAEKLRQAIANHRFDEAGRITVSFGVAQYAPGEVMADLIARADRTLYQAKANGRNRVEVAPTVLNLPGPEV
ncbi:diguanylate cyclase [Ancylobacter novellus DSM 506]|uniref:diguanylate cyclase n=1 Tax=Ancylobacter novellus (strain ATCC 8093 / DSM 506 / JCM 20403 / CCM 1077 / IAM 12100 / NBRC 12443 / NCIMB 10456) TaxID=639283 RepID=D7A7Q4_ANCN5|nr:sensor domain-containing diguanylate cyclase [Ancylobacter novellus]ADH88502.1 diguanylate cyclase [Ancylobacter novellus DSM 506]